MRFAPVNDNGNVAVIQPQREAALHRNFNNSSWIFNINSDSRNLFNITSTDNSNYNSNCNIYQSSESDNVFESNTGSAVTIDTVDVNLEAVCNVQYRLNTHNNLNLLNSRNNTQTSNLEGATETVFVPRESFFDDANVSTGSTPVDEERAFDQSDTDEMSEKAVQRVPRGIVNPNYPGFQHLAHTLQDYSSNIENFYQSENEMTDDDVDIEITDASYEPEPKLSETLIEYQYINNNNNDSNTTEETILSSSDLIAKNQILDSYIKNEIPDLLRNVSKNNNNNVDSTIFDLSYSDTDIENNFHTKDIIGDFNKEIEDEIKQLLNYNINIQDDLDELRKDIKDTFSKPIETTINNISDVVNDVIKKLVETQDSNEINENSLRADTQIERDHDDDVNKENETNTQTEMNLIRPTFLLIEKKAETITDAFLSDGKDEINISENEYDTEILSNSVERTIKQLSTELRKIIPKLDEMRVQDKLWTGNRKQNSDDVTIDGNFNEVASTSKNPKILSSHTEGKSEVMRITTFSGSSVAISSSGRSDSKVHKESKKETSSSSRVRAQSNTSSVRKNESARECDLGSFDVYNIETALPKLDIDVIESHLKAAKEAERRKRNDREEIRRRLAMGAETEEYYSMGHIDRPVKKPSLHSRLQNGKNLQICFMNETASDNESQTSDVERNSIYSSKSLSRSSIFSKNNFNHPYQTRPLSVTITKSDKISNAQSGSKLRPSSLTSKSSKSRSTLSLGHIELKESDFYALQATLQTEARIALAQAKEMARIQMERERRSRAVSPVTEMLRRSMEKANAPLAPDRRRVSRQLLTDMNIAQLQVIVNELHSQIESLNESLVKFLMQRDELHMGQDSMLVDIEDLTRYLGVKEQSKKTKGTSKSGVRRLTSLVHK